MDNNKVKRVNSVIIAAMCVLSACIMSLSACSTFPIRHISALNYIEWRDENGIFKFRAAKDGAFGCGTIVLNGEEIPASFSIGPNPPSFHVDISIEKALELGYDTTYHTSGNIAFDGFWPNYSKKDQVITSQDSDVELFGVKLGKISLKAYQLDRSEFEIWEICSTWCDSGNKLRIDNRESNYFLYKCLRAKTILPNGEAKYLTFRWLDEASGFRIYDEFKENEYKNITDETPYLAEGTYEYDDSFETITLHFVKDEIMGLQGQSLELTEF